ncbi:helix-turn-helix domain-containing protein [Microbulbifer sp. VVAC002]|uniref:helix-turn-helix domain-containing protein n=1 Tax=Microbulbifer sp. VVAC002 TaxID=3243387 RepID=UPI00403A43C4
MSLLKFAKTEAEKRKCRAFEECGSVNAAARKLGIKHPSVSRTISDLKERQALKDGSQHLDPEAVPEGFEIKGVSAYFAKTEQHPAFWLKTQRSLQQQRQLIEEFTREFIEDLPSVETPTEPQGDLDTDTIPWIQIGDGHLGMLAHEREVGHNFDLKIAERELVTAIEILIDRAPNCERCVIQDLGDMTHYETFSAKTESSGHDLDFDSRYPRMIHTYARVMRSIVEKALNKFKYVDVIVNQGNHSRSNDVWMRVFLKHVYHHTDRLQVLDNASVFIPYRMGNTFVMCHHSDKCKPAQLAQVMATDFNQDWGEANYRYIDVGHIHHRMVAKEHPGVTIESWNQLAPADKYAHDGGWRSRSCLTVVLRSKTYGEKGRITLTAEEVKDRIDSLEPGTTSARRREVYTV